jgi:hypothetical protein
MGEGPPARSAEGASMDGGWASNDFCCALMRGVGFGADATFAWVGGGMQATGGLGLGAWGGVAAGFWATLLEGAHDGVQVGQIDGFDEVLVEAGFLGARSV